MKNRLISRVPFSNPPLSNRHAKGQWVGILSCLVGLASTNSCFAVDGVIEINQARALAGGVTSADTPGYPVIIDEPGSYRLTSNLEPSGSPIAVIGIATDDVTIDLNGFIITGAKLDAGSETAGISSTTKGNISIKNGAVVDTTGTWAIQLGSESSVHDVRVVNNAGLGINCNLNCILTQCQVSRNGAGGLSANHNAIITGNVVWANTSDGIVAEVPARISDNIVITNTGSGIVTRGGTITENVVRGNSLHGIDADKFQPGSSTSNATITGNSVLDSRGGDGIRAGEGSTVLSNTVAESADVGIRMGATTGYGSNVITDNAGGQVIGGIEIGTNVCGTDTTCP